MLSERIKRTEESTRRALTIQPGRYCSATTVKAALLASIVVSFVTAVPPQTGNVIGAAPRLPGHAPAAPLGSPTGIDQSVERTATVLPSRNMDVGQPSIGRLVERARSCGGQLFTTFSEPPASVKIRDPSFFMKSDSSTPTTWVFVVV